MTLQAPPPERHTVLADMAAIIRSVDEAAAECNRKWGFNRLPHIVPLDWLEKFRRQKHKWELACFECVGSPRQEDYARVRTQADAMLRAYAKLEELAVADGHIPTPPAHWEFELADGTPVILVRTRDEIGQVDAKGRAVQIWSLEEVATVIAKFPMIATAKEAFPGAEVIQMRTPKAVHDALDDSLADLPF